MQNRTPMYARGLSDDIQKDDFTMFFAEIELLDRYH